MATRRRSVILATTTLLSGAVVVGLGLAPATADIAPQANDVVGVGSDIQQNSFNFLADGYGAIPGYNSAGNRYRIFNFDSSGDANGRSAFTDPKFAPSTVVNGKKYIPQGWADGGPDALSPTVQLRAGAPLEVRPSGGAGGLNALIRDKQGYIDYARSPNLPTAAQQTSAQSSLGTSLVSVQVGIDHDYIATATTTNAPAVLTPQVVADIYSGTITKWSQITSAAYGATYNGYSGANETIIPLYLPDTAGMRNVFRNGVRAQIGNSSWDATSPNIQIVQQNDPTAITSLPDADQKNAIVPFPVGRLSLVEKGYYADPISPSPGSSSPGKDGENNYARSANRLALGNPGIKLLKDSGSLDISFPYNAIFRESDVNSTTPWQPGSKLNWVKALFYNPDDNGPEPFVNTEAGKQLLSAAGITPSYKVTLP